MFSTDELATTERCLYFSTVYSFHVAVPHQQSQVRDVVGPLVLGGNVLIQVSEVLAAVPAIVAGVGLLWLLCGGLQPEGQWGGNWDTGGGLGSRVSQEFVWAMATPKLSAFGYLKIKCIEKNQHFRI